MNIWLVQTGEIIPRHEGDRMMRTGYLAKELLSRGHNVTWWTAAYEHQSKSYINKGKAKEKLNTGLNLRYLKSISYKRNISVRRIICHLTVAADFKKKAEQEPEKPDIIVNSLPEHNLAYHALLFGKKNNIPVIVDVRDYWPDFIVHAFKNTFLKRLTRMVLIRDFRRANFVFKNADVLVSMMQTMLKWAQDKVKRPAVSDDTVFYIGSNSLKMTDKQEANPVLSNIEEQTKDKFVVLYLGTFTKIHNPAPLIKAAHFINENTDLRTKIHFVLAGTGNYEDYSRQLAGNAPNIHFTGWLEQKDIARVLQLSNIGVIPIKSEFEFFPNKAFGYFSGGLPVLSSTVGEFHEFIYKHKLGKSFIYDDIEKLAEEIRFFYEHPEAIDAYSENVREVFSARLDSAIVYAEYADLIERTAGKSNRQLS
jgi:glycosyltransferase involved in cell wall biosynthesis